MLNLRSPAFFRRLARTKFGESTEDNQGWSIQAEQNTLEFANQVQTKLSLTSKAEGNDYLMGFLEKRVEGGKWQKRWFVLDPPNQVLRYRKSPANQRLSHQDDVVIPLSHVKIEAITCKDATKPYETPREGARVFCKPSPAEKPFDSPTKWVFLIQAKDDSTLVKGKSAMYLSAQSEGAMQAWMSGIAGAATEGEKQRAGQKHLAEKDAVSAPLVSPRVGGYSYGPASMLLRTPRDVDSLKYGSSPLSSKYNEGDHYTLKRVAEEVSAYVGCTLSTLASAIPKAIAYCMLRPARKSLMDKLYTWACNMAQNGGLGLQLLASESEQHSKEKEAMEAGIKTLNELHSVLSTAKVGSSIVVPIEALELLETFHPSPPQPRVVEEEEEDFDMAWDGMEMCSGDPSADQGTLGVGVSMLAKTPSVFFGNSLGG